MADKYFQAPCKIRMTTRTEDIKGEDFVVSATATPEGDGQFTIDVNLAAKTPFGDVQSVVGSGDVQVFDDKNAETPIGTDSGPNTAADGGVLTVMVDNVAQTSANVGNQWKAVYTNLQVLAKDGQTITVPNLAVKFTSPL